MNRMATFFWVILVSVSLVPLYSIDPTSKNDFQEHTHLPIQLTHTELSLILAQGNDMSYVVKPLMIALVTTWCTLEPLENTHTPEIKSFRQRLKDSFIEYVGAPVYITYDRIKHHGLSKKDIGIIVAALAALYAVKKGADHYHLGSALRSWDFTKVRSTGADDAALLWKYKKHILLGAGGVATLGLLIKAALNLPIIERFKRSLTRQQKEIIASDAQLLELINNAHENPTALAEHSDLIAQLNERQRKLLEKAVEKHKSDADPLSLFDDFVMDKQ